MSFLPRLLAPVIMMSMMCGTALPQSARPEGIPSPDDTWKLPNRDAMNANTVTVITAPAGGATAIFGSDIRGYSTMENSACLRSSAREPPIHMTRGATAPCARADPSGREVQRTRRHPQAARFAGHCGRYRGSIGCQRDIGSYTMRVDSRLESVGGTLPLVRQVESLFFCVVVY